MSIRFMQRFIPVGAIALGSILTISSQPSSANAEKSISCETGSGVPITTFHDGNRSEPAFYWRQEVLPPEVNARQLCEQLSQPLEALYASENSANIALTFKTIAENTTRVCVEQAGNCRINLFDLDTTSQEEIDKVLESIVDLDPNQESQIIRGDNTTGVQMRWERFLELL